MESIVGTVRLPDGWAPARGDQLRVTLEDVSRADGIATVLAEHRALLGDDTRPAFTLTYDVSAVAPRSRLAVRAQVLRGQTLVLTSTQHVPAPDPGTGDPVEIVLHEVATTRTTGAPESALVGSWEVREIEGATVEPGLRGAPLTVTFHGGVVTGFSGCNTFRASCRVTGQQIELGPLAATRRACVTGMDQEHRLLRVLEAVTGFQRNGPRLALTGSDGQTLVELAVPGPQART